MFAWYNSPKREYIILYPATITVFYKIISVTFSGIHFLPVLIEL